MTQRKKMSRHFGALTNLGHLIEESALTVLRIFLLKQLSLNGQDPAWRFSQHGALRPADLSLTEPCSVLVAIMFVWTGSCLITQLVGRTVDMLATAT